MNSVALDYSKKALVDSALNLSPKIYKIFNSIFDKGLDLNYRITLEDYNNLEMGYGLKAGENIREHQVLLMMPVERGFNGMDLIDFREDISSKAIKELSWKIAKTLFPNNKFRQDKNFQNQMIMWQIILNLYYKDAYNHDFVMSFPTKELANPMYASTEIYNKILSPNLKKFYYVSKYSMDFMYEMIKKEGIYDFKYEQVAWAYNIVLSRKLTFIEDESQTPYQLVMPIFDFINHSSSKVNCMIEPHYNNIERSSSVCLRATRDIKEGEQLFFDYGPMNNKKFMHMYGFVDLENPNFETEFGFINNILPQLLEFNYDQPDISIYNEFNKYLHSSQTEKKEIATKNSLKFEKYFPECELMLYKNKFDQKFVKFLRIIYLDDEEILNNKEVIYSHDFSNLYSFNNEKKVYRYIKYILEKYYSFIKGRNHQDMIGALGVIDNLEKYKTKCMLLLENEEQILLEKNINYINKKMKSLL